MVMIYKLTSDNKIELIKEAIALVPSLAFLGEKELRYIIMSYDYINGPFSVKPEQERIELALQILWQDKKKQSDVEDSVVKEAIESYNSLIYDNLRYTLNGIKRKLNILMRKLADFDIEDEENDLKRFKMITDAISHLEKQISDLEKQVYDDTEKLKLKGRKEESMIEQLKRSKKLWTIENKNYAGSRKSN